MFFLVAHANTNNRLHSIIVKEHYGPIVYISGIGYSGGGCYDEFCGKFQWDFESDEYLGLYSKNYHDPDYWDSQLERSIVIECEIKIDQSDRLIIEKMKDQIWTELIYSDEDGNRNFYDSFLSKLNSENTFNSADWDSNTVDWVSNHIWGLNYRFDW
jgi:hypothetical protein